MTDDFGYRIEVYKNQANNNNYFKMKGDIAKPIIDCIEKKLITFAGYTFGEVNDKSRIMKIDRLGGHQTKELFIYYLKDHNTYRIIVKDHEYKLKHIEKNLIMANESIHSPFIKKSLNNTPIQHRKNNDPIIEHVIKPNVKLISNDEFWNELKGLYEYNKEFKSKWTNFIMNQAGGGSKKKKSVKKNTKK